jgi:hypothetical protein
MGPGGGRCGGDGQVVPVVIVAPSIGAQSGGTVGEWKLGSAACSLSGHAGVSEHLTTYPKEIWGRRLNFKIPPTPVFCFVHFGEYSMWMGNLELGADRRNC